MLTNFKPIPGFENYVINQLGEIRRLFQRKKNKRGRMHTYKEMLISTRIDKRSGYPVVKLTDKNGVDSTQYIHRLLALSFIPNPENKPYVNHRNGNKKDYSISNLEWVTASENSKHAIQNNLVKPFQKTPVVDQCTNRNYDGMKEAAADLNIKYESVKSMLSGIVDCLQCLQRLNRKDNTDL